MNTSSNRLVNAKQNRWKTQLKSKKIARRKLSLEAHPAARFSIGEENTKDKAESKKQKKCGRGQPPQPHRPWIF
jgi:hypothetical protein